MLDFNSPHVEMERDHERRFHLRTFLTDIRSRLKPDELGLPRTLRRRVSGLRRAEVAELTGVSTDWYRSLERGKPVRVSPQFLSRLVTALHLTQREALTLYWLAIPEMYCVARACDVAVT